MTTREKTADHAELARLAEAATKGPWDRMAGRGLVRAIRGDLAVPLFEPLEPYSDPLLEATTCRVGGEVVFRANSQAARESAAIRQAVHNAAFIAAANPATVLALLSEIAALKGERRNIVSHATMGATDGEGLSCNEVSVAITRLRNEMHDRATQAERQRDELRKALSELRIEMIAARNDIGVEDWISFASEALATQGADQ